MFLLIEMRSFFIFLRETCLVYDESIFVPAIFYLDRYDLLMIVRFFYLGHLFSCASFYLKHPTKISTKHQREASLRYC